VETQSSSFFFGNSKRTAHAKPHSGIFSIFAKTLDQLTNSTTSGLERARENAHAFVLEAVDAFEAIQQEKKR
jgi:hypothetical protein